MAAAVYALRDAVANVHDSTLHAMYCGPQTKGKSKYGMPIFLPNGNVNPAYLAAERKEAAAIKTVHFAPNVTLQR